MFLKNRNISSKIKISKVTDYAALKSILTTKDRTRYQVLLEMMYVSAQVNGNLFDYTPLMTDFTEHPVSPQIT